MVLWAAAAPAAASSSMNAAQSMTGNGAALLHPARRAALLHPARWAISDPMRLLLRRRLTALIIHSSGNQISNCIGPMLGHPPPQQSRKAEKCWLTRCCSLPLLKEDSIPVWYVCFRRTRGRRDWMAALAGMITPINISVLLACLLA